MAAWGTLLFSILLLDPFSALSWLWTQMDSPVGSSELGLPARLGRTSGGGPKSELGYKSPDPCLAFLCQMWPLVLSSGGGSLPTALWPLARWVAVTY